jgi:hypothetical protein
MVFPRHVSVPTTERYLGCKQRFRVNHRIGVEPDDDCQSTGHTRAAMREESWHGKEVGRPDRSRQLLHLKVAIAGRIACEANVRDASELCMSLEWARRAEERGQIP